LVGDLSTPIGYHEPILERGWEPREVNGEISEMMELLESFE